MRVAALPCWSDLSWLHCKSWGRFGPNQRFLSSSGASSMWAYQSKHHNLLCMHRRLLCHSVPNFKGKRNATATFHHQNVIKHCVWCRIICQANCYQRRSVCAENNSAAYFDSIWQDQHCAFVLLHKKHFSRSCIIASRACREGFFYEVRLERLVELLIALTRCLSLTSRLVELLVVLTPCLSFTVKSVSSVSFREISPIKTTFGFAISTDTYGYKRLNTASRKQPDIAASEHLNAWVHCFCTNSQHYCSVSKLFDSLTTNVVWNQYKLAAYLMWAP